MTHTYIVEQKLGGELTETRVENVASVRSTQWRYTELTDDKDVLLGAFYEPFRVTRESESGCVLCAAKKYREAQVAFIAADDASPCQGCTP